MYEQDRREPDNHILARICLELKTSGDYLLNIKTTFYGKEVNDVYSVISDFIDFFENQDNLIFNGEPINNLEKKRIASALKVATAVSMSELNEINK